MQSPTVAPPMGAPAIPMRAVPVAPVAAGPPTAVPPKSTGPSGSSSGPPGERLVRLHNYEPVRSSFGLIKGLIVFLLIVLSVGVVYLGYTIVEPHVRGPGKTPSASGGGGGGQPAAVVSGVPITLRNKENKEERVLSSTLDKEYWTDDRDLKTQFRALVACRHVEEKADSWFAIVAQDFGVQMPRQSELMNGAVDRLRKNLGDTLQFSDKLEKGKVLGDDAMMFPFRGRTTVIWEGECFLVAKQGIGYWILIAGTDADIQSRIKKRLEDEMTLSVDRRGWREQPAEMDTFVAAKDAFVVKVPLGVWQKYDAEPEDAAGVLFLAATAADGDVKKAANMLAVRLAKTADPKEAFESARKFFTARAKASANEYAVALVDDREPAKPIDLGGMPGMVAELRLVRAGETVRYWVLGSVTIGDATYAVRFECGWDRRTMWKSDFLDALKTVQTTKK
jgi:hypothetical protein